MFECPSRSFTTLACTPDESARMGPCVCRAAGCGVNGRTPCLDGELLRGPGEPVWGDRPPELAGDHQAEVGPCFPGTEPLRRLTCRVLPEHGHSRSVESDHPSWSRRPNGPPTHSPVGARRGHRNQDMRRSRRRIPNDRCRSSLSRSSSYRVPPRDSRPPPVPGFSCSVPAIRLHAVKRPTLG